MNYLKVKVIKFTILSNRNICVGKVRTTQRIWLVSSVLVHWTEASL